MRTNHMRRFLVTFLSAACATLATAAGARAQTSQDGYIVKKRAECESASRTEQHWETLGQGKVYFDYVLCPAGLEPPSPLVMILITAHVKDQVVVEKWAKGRDGADLVALLHGRKVAFTLYRDLAAVPLNVFKAERRAGVPAEIARRPFVVEGPRLIPFEHLTPDSAERVERIFRDADVLVRHAQEKAALIRDWERIALMLKALDQPPRARN